MAGRQHITKGHREIWTYYIGLLRNPADPEELSPEEKQVLAFLKKSGGAVVRTKLYSELHPKISTIASLDRKGLIWQHATRTSISGFHPHSESVVIVPGVPIPDGPDRVTVVDEDSFNRALELMGRGPVIISTKTRMYTIDDFDQAAEIVSDQLVKYGYALVEVKRPSAPQPSKSSLSLPVPPIVGEPAMVKVIDDKTFEKALEMVTRGPVTISAGKLIYRHVDDFDKAAERLVYLMNIGYQPWVDSRDI